MHHANLITGGREWALAQIPKEESIQSPDVLTYAYDRMSIADVRALIYEAGLRPVSRPYRTFILLCDSILHEAQNALLKLFEEPNEHTIFFLVLPREDMLLPTLRSRLNMFAQEEIHDEKKIFEPFLQMGYSDRLTEIADRLKKEDTAWVFAIVSGCVAYAHGKKDMVLIREALLVESYIYGAGSSKKMLLEHLALSLKV